MNKELIQNKIVERMVPSQQHSKQAGNGLSLAFVLAFSFFSLLLPLSTFAEELNDSQKAMKLAETQTDGKAVSSKYVQEGDKTGYKVRILKDGNVSHVFISLDSI